MILPVYLAMAVIKQPTTPSPNHAVCRQIILIKRQLHQAKPAQYHYPKPQWKINRRAQILQLKQLKHHGITKP